MSDFTKEALKNLEKLCRIKCTEKEEEKLVDNLQKILSFVEKLNELDIKESKQGHLLDEEELSLRKDEVNNTLSNDLFLSNAPDQIGGMVKVPQVIENQE